MAAKPTTTSGFSFLTRIPKLLGPFLLYAVIGILHTVVKRVYMNPLVAEMSRRLSEMDEHTGHSSAEYARLLQETKQEATSLVVTSIAVALLTLPLAFAKQIVALFADSSATNSGDHFSLAELLREVTKWQNLKFPLVVTAVVTMFQLLLWLVSEQGSLFLVAFLAFFYLSILAVTSVGSRREEFSVMVLVTLLLPTLLIPLCAFLLLHLYTKHVMGLGLSLLSVYDLLQGMQDLLYLLAAGVYYSCYQSKDMKESKEMVVAKSQYFTYAILFVLWLLYMWQCII